MDDFPIPPSAPSEAGATSASARGLDRGVLEHAWRFFATCDEKAKQLQKSFRRFQTWILALGIGGVVLALGQKQMALHFAERTARDEQFKSSVAAVERALSYPIILAPITVTLLLTLSHRFRPGNRWVLLRGCAETVRREIYACRLGAGRYGAAKLAGRPASDVFRERIEGFARRLMQTEVNTHALGHYTGKLPPKMDGAAGEDDGFSPLAPPRYLEVAIRDQLNYYAGRTTKLEHELRLLVWLVVLSGAAGTFLAAIKLELWIALTTALTTAFTTHLKTWQVEETLVTYNQCATDLRAVLMWWEALPPAAPHDPADLDRLLDVTEKILESETAGWSQRMADALASLRAPEPAAGAKAAPANPAASHEKAPAI